MKKTFHTHLLTKVFTASTLTIALTATQPLHGMQEENNFFEKFERVHTMKNEPGSIKSMVSKDNVIFVLLSTGFVDIFDVANPQKPRFIKTIETASTQELKMPKPNLLGLSHKTNTLYTCLSTRSIWDKYLNFSYKWNIKKPTNPSLSTDWNEKDKIETHFLFRNIPMVEDPISGIAFSQAHFSESTIEVIALNNCIDLNNGSPHWPAYDPIKFLAYNSMTQYLSSSDGKKNIRIWDVKKPTEPILKQHIRIPKSSTITTLTFANNTLVFAFDDGTIEFWKQPQNIFSSHNYKKKHIEYVENNGSDLAKFYFDFDD